MTAHPCAALILSGAVSCGVLANADADSAYSDYASKPPPRTSIEVESVGPALNVRAPLTTTTLPGDPATLRSDSSGDYLRTRWWWHLGAVGVGGGGDWLLGSGVRPVLGLRANLTRQASLVYERLPVGAAAAPAGLDSVLPDEQRWALEFKPAGNSASMYAGLVRIQLSGSSTLLLRPRSGGLMLSWRSRF